MLNLRGKTALVTGASAGIGRAIASQLAQEGCRVALIAASADALQQATDAIRTQGGMAEAFVCDLNDTPAFLQTLAIIEDRLGPVDILVNNVGVGTFRPLPATRPEDVLAPVQLPLAIALIACHAVAPGMLQRHCGHIVNLTSPAGYFPFPNMLPYAASRWGMVGLSHCLYEELAPQGVGVSLICPGKVNTGYFARNDADMDWFPRLAKIVPMVEPEDVAARVVDAIRHGRREVIFPWLLGCFVRFYQKFPGLTLAMLKFLGLWRPVRPA